MAVGVENVLNSLLADQRGYSTPEINRKQIDNAFEFFGCSKNPFLDSVDTHFFYQTKQHEEAFLKMLLCIENDVAIGMVHAESGVGKTMVSQVLLMNIDPKKYKTVLVLVYPEMSRASLLREICVELELIEYEDKILASQLLHMLQEYVMDLHKENKKLVLIIDEAHFLKPECLHTLRTISNIEVPERKLTTMILIGEDRLWRRLQRDSYASIRTRIYQKLEVPPLTLMDTTEYIKFRLLVANGTPDIFDSNIYLGIYRASKGICRNINKICYNLMLEGYFKKTRHIDSTIFEQVMKKVQ